MRRYTSPEELAFFPQRIPNAGPVANLPSLVYPEILMSDAVNVNFNPILLEKYIKTVIPSLTTHGDDEQHGSCTLSDIAALQALSRRVHYGKFVAESKYRADPEGYQRLVDANDADGVMVLLTNAPVEKLVLRRARLKAATYGREPLLSASLQMEEVTDENTAIIAAAAASAVVAAVEAMDGRKQHGKVDPCVIESIYRDIIIPITKDVEVAYLFRRCGKEPPPEYTSDRMSIEVKAAAAAAATNGEGHGTQS
jgi:chorismate mutase